MHDGVAHAKVPQRIPSQKSRESRLWALGWGQLDEMDHLEGMDDVDLGDPPTDIRPNRKPWAHDMPALREYVRPRDSAPPPPQDVGFSTFGVGFV